MACSTTVNYWDWETPLPKVIKENVTPTSSSIPRKKRGFGQTLNNLLHVSSRKHYFEEKTAITAVVTPSKNVDDKENFWCPSPGADADMGKSTSTTSDEEEFPDNYSSDCDFIFDSLPLEVLLSEPESETDEQEINLDLEYDPEARRSLTSMLDGCLRTFKGLHGGKPRNPTDAANISEVEDKVWAAFNKLLHNRRIPSCILLALEESVVNAQLALQKYPRDKKGTMNDLTKLFNVARVGSFFRDTLNNQTEDNKLLWKKPLGTKVEELLKKKRGRKSRKWETDEKKILFETLFEDADFPLMKKYRNFKPILTKIAEYLSESTKLFLPTRHQLFKFVQMTCKNQFLFLANLQTYQLVRDVLKKLAPVIQKQQKTDMEISRKEKKLLPGSSSVSFG